MQRGHRFLQHHWLDARDRRRALAPTGFLAAHARAAQGLIAWLLLCALWLVFPVQAQPFALSARVIDQTATLTDSQRRALEDKLAAFERERGSQVVVLLVRTTAPEDIADYTQRLGDAWKIGRKGVGDGVLLVVAKDDRRLRIATAKAVEGAIPDVVAGRIIEQVITPRFKQGDFAGGINAGVDQILARLKGEELPLPDTSQDIVADESLTSNIGVSVLVLCVGLLFGILLRGFLGTALSSKVAAGLAALIVWSFSQTWWLAVVTAVLVAFLLRGIARFSDNYGGGWGGGGFGGGSGGGFSSGGSSRDSSSSSDGFSSGGGGDFGGGGSSGRW